MRFSARLLGITIALFLVFFVAKVSFAQTAPTSNAALPSQQYNQQLQANTNPDVPENLHTYTQSVMIEVMSAMSCALMGSDPITKGQCLGSDQKTGKLGYVQRNGGVPAVLGELITVLYLPPIHTSQYVQYLSQNFGIAKQTYAQGIGYNQLSPLITLWTKFRDMTYLLFVFVFIIVGIAIMLRVRIDPRTVMTIQNQIPKMIIGIILVTLSFPIAGLMVDLMWVSTYTVVNVISSADANAQPADFQTQLTSAPPNFVNTYFQSTDTNGGIHHVASEVSDTINTMIQNLFANQKPANPGAAQPTVGTSSCNNPIFCAIGAVYSATIGAGVNAVISAFGSIFNFMGGIVTSILQQLVGFVAFLIIAIAIIYSLFKLWFALIKAYIMILIDVIFAPFWIIGGLLPGSTSLGFTNWLRNLAGNLAVFPAVVAFFAIGKVFIDSYYTASTTSSSQMFIPPLIGNVQGTNIVSSLIALGIILGSPQLVDTVKKAFKGGQGGAGGGGGGFLGGAAIGAALGVGANVVGTPVNKARKAAFGMDPRTGQPKFGSAFLGRTFGGVGQVLTGGGIEGVGKWVRNPGTFRGWGGKAVKGIGGKVVSPVASKVAASPLGQRVGQTTTPVRQAVKQTASKVAASPLGQKVGQAKTKISQARGKVNAAVPHYESQTERSSAATATAAAGAANAAANAAAAAAAAAKINVPAAPTAPPGPQITIARGQADVEAAKKAQQGGK